ncbi:hypothetical protein CEP48_03155 [Mergibacter septicus]|uniref:Uncharacterized protein n=1 Tax=Mergibacter septicus TaxID=221402 RepID=A0A8D4IZS0_9PAST|nr:DUF3486 family protein [Mergibacter septicus]AWX15222.1 hypothetical protein CEP47_03155 [Mergibacter septicus]QDJ14476.1 hypothetical protein CEP48_03155 [Mergibacter septicus]UTU48087.1 DUF3486 family protein [Mergibacter septicus]WMR96301.1 DUF3486 family protein [Mergibacter septicus]
MTEKIKRGRASKVDLLPVNIKTQLAMMLRDKQFSQAEILEEINELIRDCGLPESALLSKTGLNRYATRMEKMGAKIRQSREIAEIWTKQFGEAPQSDIGKMLMEIVKNIAFETSLGMSEDGTADPKSIALLSAAVQRLEQAESLSFKREQAIRQETIKRAAEAVEEAAKETGASIEDVTKMVKAVYGIE